MLKSKPGETIALNNCEIVNIVKNKAGTTTNNKPEPDNPT